MNPFGQGKEIPVGTVLRKGKWKRIFLGYNEKGLIIYNTPKTSTKIEVHASNFEGFEIDGEYIPEQPNNLKEFLTNTNEFDSIDKQKLMISSVIYEKMKEHNYAIGKLADQIEGIGPAQIFRVLHGENYNVMTLLKILDFFDLELQIGGKGRKKIEP